MSTTAQHRARTIARLQAVAARSGVVLRPTRRPDGQGDSMTDRPRQAALYKARASFLESINARHRKGQHLHGIETREPIISITAWKERECRDNDSGLFHGETADYS